MKKDRITIFKPTSDDWLSSYPVQDREQQGLVKILFTTTGPNPPENGEWRVVAWGTDDFGIGKPFKNRDEAVACFKEVINMADVTIEALEALGFYDD